MDDLLGQLVVSLTGRDKDCICAVVGISEDEGYVLIADGKIRKVEKPKKKKTTKTAKKAEQNNQKTVSQTVEQDTTTGG